MTRLHATFWIGLLLMAILSLYLLHDILMPFVIGFALAYFLDPAADRLEGLGLPRSLSALVVLFIFLIVIAIIALAFWPILASQAESFIKNLPGLLEKAGSTILPLFERLMTRFQEATNSAGTTAAQSASPLSGLTTQAGQWLVGFASGVLTRGMALFNLLALLFVTPVVAFFLLRDWDIIVARINSWLPRAYAPAIRDRANEIDHVLSGYLRGQATVALVMAILYGIGWTIVGLH
jgi:predicted PurR-regulated permease PerM